jgi:Uma2 family endonuclease
MAMSLQEFMQHYQAEGPFEVFDGQRVDLAHDPHDPTHVARRLYDKLDGYASEKGTGTALLSTPFILLNDDGTVVDARLPDVMFFHTPPIAEEDAPITTPPDLAIEVASPGEHIVDVYKRVSRFLQIGVKRMWVIDPTMHTLAVYRQGTKNFTVLGARKTLEDEELLPGFKLEIGSLFE